MKKIIGILGVAVIAATMFFSANNVAGSGSDASLASVVGMNSANAEVVCSVKSGSTVILSCSTATTNCSKTKLGYTITCTNARLD